MVPDLVPAGGRIDPLRQVFDNVRGLLSNLPAAVRVAGEHGKPRRTTMTQYLLSMYQPDGPVPPPEVLERIMRELATLNDQMRETGAWVFAAGLHPPETATVLRVPQRGADVLVTDGPYLEGKEHIGGFTVVEAEDLDAALHWARQLAAVVSPLAVEVRPFQSR
jgi:hypothetical protein